MAKWVLLAIFVILVVIVLRDIHQTNVNVDHWWECTKTHTTSYCNERYR